MTGAVALVGVLFLSAATSGRTPAPSQNPLELRGTVTGWSLQADGSLRIRMLTGENEGTRTLWFATPPDQTRTTRFEHMLLDILLDGSDGSGIGQQFLIRAERDEVDDGETQDEALPLLSVSKLD